MSNFAESVNMDDKRRTLLICAALAVATFAAFEGVRNNGFVNYDDDVYVTDNPAVKSGLNLESIRWVFTTWYAANWHPLTWVSHLIDVSVFGLNPAGHHLASVGFHIANVILLFLILKKMTGAIWLSAFVAALFGVHPLGVESVAWAAERKNVLSNFFAFLTIWAYLRYVQKPGLWRYSAMAILFTAGLLSKSMLVTLPFVLILLDYWPIARFGELKGWRWLWRAIVDKLPLMAISATFCVVTYLAQLNAGGVSDMVLLPLGLRAENAAVSYIMYIGKIFYPTSLAVLYPLDVNGYPSWKVILCLVLLLTLTTAAIIERRRHRFLLTGWFWYLGTLVPVIGLVQVGAQSMADRYTYLPGIGIYIIVAWLMGKAVAKLRLPKIVPAMAGAIILVALLLVTRTQVAYWKNSLTLCEHTLAITKNNYVIENNCGEALRAAGHLDDAIEHYKQAIKINPAYEKTHNNFGLALSDKELLPEAEAEFERAIAIRPGYVKAHNNYGVVLAEHGRFSDAIREFGRALSINPYYQDAMNNIWRAGIEGDMLNAVLEVLLSLQQKTPSYAELYYKAGVIYDEKGEPKKAIEQLEKGLMLADEQGNKELIVQIKKQLEWHQRRMAN